MKKQRPTRTPPPQDCPIDVCLQLLAGAWTLKVLWYLCDEPRRFGDLRRDIGKITSKVLTARLREMEELGVVTREVIPTSPPQVEYSLTKLGRELKPVLDAIAQVGGKLRKRNK